MCKTFEERKTARAEYSAGLTELQAAIGYVNCKSIENTTEPIGEYVKMLEIVSKIETLVDRFKFRCYSLSVLLLHINSCSICFYCIVWHEEKFIFLEKFHNSDEIGVTRSISNRIIQ
ncbi:hypothetical protein B9Z55_010463 [Caenorhabditis nigoni]|uniref:Uncharacterized protein n=1 Tax=Caenorhabditis nigoni TaxID=1611254 RepID=A0A2G5UG70_9PELO|nr:hypothetical protein B9Z55_010463 [Caenorhabditis nigoni]